jgi:hypothetical protein
MRYIIVILSFLLFTACRIAKPVINEVPIQYKEKVVERLVAVQSPADSANIVALFECDSTNQVIMKAISEQKGKSVLSRFSFDKGSLNYQFKTAPTLTYTVVKDSIVYREVAIKVPVEVKVNELTWWQKTQIIAFRILAGVFAVGFAWRFLKPKISL